MDGPTEARNAHQHAPAAARIEVDFLGEHEVPSSALYGISTARALANSGLGGATLGSRPILLESLAQVKLAAVRANRTLGVLPPDVAEALETAATEIASGSLDVQFPLEILQGGGGTAINNNLNEVLANRAAQLLGGRIGTYDIVDPHQHANRSQSTNDVFPTAMSIAVHRSIAPAVYGLSQVHRRLHHLSDRYRDKEHLARTCLQDALPVPIAAVHDTHAHAVSRARDDLAKAGDRLLDVPLGATAVGSGLGAPRGYTEAAVGQLARITGLPIRAAQYPGDGLASLEPFSTVADEMARAGRVLARIAGDLRLLASGPVGGVGEVILPAVQAGSSIMPGKVNPVLPELVIQTYYRLSGAAHAIALASGSVELEVTPMGPLVIEELLEGLTRLATVAPLFADRCLADLSWRISTVNDNLRGSYAEAVRLADEIGYDDAARQQLHHDQTALGAAIQPPGPRDAAMSSSNRRDVDGDSPTSRR